MVPFGVYLLPLSRRLVDVVQKCYVVANFKRRSTDRNVGLEDTEIALVVLRLFRESENASEFLNDAFWLRRDVLELLVFYGAKSQAFWSQLNRRQPCRGSFLIARILVVPQKELRL